MINKVFTFGGLLLAFAVLLNASPTLGEGVLMTLVYSSNTLGEVDPSC
jgi:hypothetical protein